MTPKSSFLMPVFSPHLVTFPTEYVIQGTIKHTYVDIQKNSATGIHPRLLHKYKHNTHQNSGFKLLLFAYLVHFGYLVQVRLL